jgi:hypothetical protein
VVLHPRASEAGQACEANPSGTPSWKRFPASDARFLRNCAAMSAPIRRLHGHFSGERRVSARARCLA